MSHEFQLTVSTAVSALVVPPSEGMSSKRGWIDRRKRNWWTGEAAGTFQSSALKLQTCVCDTSPFWKASFPFLTTQTANGGTACTQSEITLPALKLRLPGWSHTIRRKSPRVQTWNVNHSNSDTISRTDNLNVWHPVLHFCNQSPEMLKFHPYSIANNWRVQRHTMLVNLCVIFSDSFRCRLKINTLLVWLNEVQAVSIIYIDCKSYLHTLTFFHFRLWMLIIVSWISVCWF